MASIDRADSRRSPVVDSVAFRDQREAMSLGRIALVLLSVIAVVASILLRREQADHEPSIVLTPVQASRGGRSPAAPANRPVPPAGERLAPAAGSARMEPRQPEHHSSAPEPSNRQAESAVIRTRSTFDNSGGDQARAEVVRKLPARGEAVSGQDPRTDDSWRDDLPLGTRFAATFHGVATAADGSQPVVDKNTAPDGNDGLYFPADAELAYANRAGVQGDAGTIALRVEPVDWAGGDASVHSFFRLNDPAEGGYRFHLLKDASSLRLQFITEVGETNLRVPIEWWPRGEGHHVAATWDSNVLRLFVDGVPLAEQPYEGTLRVPDSALGWWGSNLVSGTAGAGAVLKNTLVAERPFVDSEIQGLSQAN